MLKLQAFCYFYTGLFLFTSLLSRKHVNHKVHATHYKVIDLCFALLSDIWTQTN